MITILDATDYIYTWLKDKQIKTAVTGGLYKHKRPVNSAKEDVVIIPLTLDADQLQEGIMNVNIHVPNLVLGSGATQDKTQPDHARLKQLTTMAVEVLTDIWLDDGQVNFSVLQPLMFEDAEINQHYMNIRLSFGAVNL